MLPMSVCVVSGLSSFSFPKSFLKHYIVYKGLSLPDHHSHMFLVNVIPNIVIITSILLGWLGNKLCSLALEKCVHLYTRALERLEALD